MNPLPDWAMWQGWLLRLALGVTFIVALTGIIARFCPSGLRQRTIWRGGFVALAMFVVCELAGIGALLALTNEKPAELPAPLEMGVNNGFETPPDGGNFEGADVAFVPRNEASIRPIWWPGFVWLTGTALWLGRSLFVAAMLLLWRRRHCQVLTNEELTVRVRAVGMKLGLRRFPRIMESSAVVTPAVAGLWRPRLILPLRFADDFEPAKQEVMLAHELAHVAGHDPLWRAFAGLLVALLWWQPLVWWARHRLRSANELAADEASCTIADGPALLAACLVEMGGKLTRAPRSGWLGMAGFRSSLGRRVERLLAMKTSTLQASRRMRTVVLLTLLPALLTAGAVFSIAWAQPFEGDSNMSTKVTWKRSLAGIVLCTTFGIGAESQAQQGRPQPPGPQALPGEIGQAIQGFGEGAADGDMVLKVFRLKHRDPEALVNVANQLVTGSSGMPGAGSFPGPGTGAPGPVGFGRGSEGSPFGFSMLRLAADKRTRTLIARGPAKEVQIVADLVAILDVQNGDALPKLKNLRVFRLKHADARNVLGVLATLEIVNAPGTCAAVERNTLIVMGEASLMRQIAEVIQVLDVEGERLEKKK